MFQLPGLDNVQIRLFFLPMGFPYIKAYSDFHIKTTILISGPTGAAGAGAGKETSAGKDIYIFLFLKMSQFLYFFLR